MHYSSQVVMARCIRRHVLTDPALSERRGLSVIDVGGADVNGSYRPLFESLGASYLSVDISAGPGVDRIMARPDRIDAPDQSFDVVVCGQTIEHCWNFWDLFAEMVRVCRHDGLIVLVAPSSGVEHRYPVDCYRFYPDSFRALADAHDLDVREITTSPFGPFFDLVGVFSRVPKAVSDERTARRFVPTIAQNEAPTTTDPAFEVMSGSMPARDFLGRVHRSLAPRGYLETGVWMGHSLRLAQCPAVGIDPYPDVRVNLDPRHHVVETTSDEFFDREGALDLVPSIDLAYIDGLHLIENALLDFMNVEKFGHADTVVVIDDVHPNHPVQAQRRRASKAWTGDVWKIAPILREQRSDLILLPVDTYPTGSLVVIGLDPENRQLWGLFDLLLSFESEDYPPSRRILTRAGAIDPADRFWTVLFETIRDRREGVPASRSWNEVRSLIDGALPREVGRRG